VAARGYHDKVIARPFGEPLGIVDCRFPESAEIADLGTSTLDRASAHRADGAGVDAELLGDVRNERGPDRGRCCWETSCALKEVQEQCKVQAVRVAPRVAQFALFSGEYPGLEIASPLRRIPSGAPTSGRPRRAAKVYHPRALENVPGVGGHLKVYQNG